MQWKIQVKGHTSSLEVFEERAPKTVAAISNRLPMKIDLHYAKIAGQEVYGMIPLILPLENKGTVGDFETGTVAYYPDMQMFCIFHGKVQPENAPASVIGKIHPDPALFQILESIKDNPGVELLLSDSDDFGPLKPFRFRLLGEKWGTFWEKPVEEITALTKRTGQTMPSGPILLSWGSVISFRGFLWNIYQLFQEKGYFDEMSFRAVAEHAKAVLQGWYGLTETAAAIDVFAESICRGKE